MDYRKVINRDKQQGGDHLAPPYCNKSKKTSL